MTPLSLIAAALALPQDPPHLEHARLALSPPAARPLPPPPAPLPRPGVTVYGYLPYWISGGLDAVPWDHLTHLAVFDVALESDGSISGTSFWDEVADDAVALGEARGVRVHLTVTCFDDAIMNSVLPSASRRTRAVQELAALVEARGAHGVNVDFEGMDSARRADLVDFVIELREAVGEVVLATPAVDWQGAYDYDQLALHSDGLFIMGYGYHWSGGDPGPIAPLFGGGIWSAYSLEWTVADYRANGAPDDKIILGLPLYGREWPTTSTAVPGEATGSGSAVVLADAVDLAAAYGRRWDATSHTPYAFPSDRAQLWYDDTDSVRDRVAWAAAEGLAGVGFWALGYEAGDPDFWAMMAEETFAEEEEEQEEEPGGEPEEGAPVARAGQEILAYVGQIVVLNGSASRGETFTWAQVSGPVDVALRDADTPEPRFDADVEGVFRFSLAVGAGEDLDSDEVEVVVVAAPAVATCAAAPGGTAALGGLALLALGLARRRLRTGP